MFFVINGQIIFDANKCSLSNASTHDEINLPATAGCILVVLLENNGGVVERNSIIEKVWDKFSFDLSSNTLNQYISVLRKNFKNLGIEGDVILTVPRVGFYISDTITVSKRPYNSGSQENIGKIENERKGTIFCALAFISAIIVAVEFFALIFKSDININDYPLVKSGKIVTCDMYLSENLSEIGFDKSRQEAKAISEKYLPCVSGAVFIYDVNSLHYLYGDGRVYLARCIKSSHEERYTICSEVSLYE